MSDKVFFDTNLWVYFYTKTEPKKVDVMLELLGKNEHVFASTQVLNELSYVLTKKFKVSHETTISVVTEIRQNCSLYIIEFSTIINALDVSRKHKIAFFDSLMVAAAIECGCSILYSEDMHDGHVIDGVLRIVNPFKKE